MRRMHEITKSAVLRTREINKKAYGNKLKYFVIILYHFNLNVGPRPESTDVTRIFEGSTVPLTIKAWGHWFLIESSVLYRCPSVTAPCPDNARPGGAGVPNGAKQI